jgi:2-keto-4-pentenoate hydratase/2-oxohepta-3-ene-1,7-dioic acid hydratase in catechol pathway
LAYQSIADGLQPGDVIGSGTVGNGSGFELGKRLSPGDVVELTVEGIGTLRNIMGAVPEQYPWWPPQKPNPFEAEAVAGHA